jgi:hypothetical protein
MKVGKGPPPDFLKKLSSENIKLYKKQPYVIAFLCVYCLSYEKKRQVDGFTKSFWNACGQMRAPTQLANNTQLKGQICIKKTELYMVFSLDEF